MKNSIKTIFTLIAALTALTASAQYPLVTVQDIQEVSATNLDNCNDSSSYYGDTVTIVCKVIADGNLVDVPSSSVQGGYRPFIHVVDTANNGESGGFHGIEVMGVYQDAGGNDLPVLDVYNLTAGMNVKLTGIIARYAGNTQLNILNNSSMTVLSTGNAPAAKVVDLGLLNDDTRTNQLSTGEEYEGSFVEIKDLTVSAVYNFSGNRVSFDVTDKNGNTINVSDRYLVQKTTSYTTTRTSAPYKTGRFVPPVVGTKYDYIKGVILQSENGCTGQNGRGYEINPFDTSHYKVGVTPPNISEVTRNPGVPGANDDVKISAQIVDFDGTITSTDLYYSTNETDPKSSFTKVTMTLVSGTTDEFEATIPGQPDGTVVRYYITAEDNDNQVSYEPFGAERSSNPDFSFYTVRDGGLTITDIQKVLSTSNDASPYLGQEVTVKGIVTATAKSYDLENIYIQEEGATEWGGIKLTGNSALLSLFRRQEVEVTGTVVENYGFTMLNVSSVTVTGNLGDATTPGVDPSDSAMFASKEAEKYEGMLVAYTVPSGKVIVSKPKVNNYGEWAVSDNQDATYDRAGRMQSGSQSSTNESSLWVSLVPDTSLANKLGTMNVEAIATEKGQSFDSIVGEMIYAFSVYKLLPRNNNDFKGSSVTLDQAQDPNFVSVQDLIRNVGLKAYPNPGNGSLTIEVDNIPVKGLQVVITDITGKHVLDAPMTGSEMTMNTSSLNTGIYLVHLVTKDGVAIANLKYVAN